MLEKDLDEEIEEYVKNEEELKKIRTKSMISGFVSFLVILLCTGFVMGFTISPILDYFEYRISFFDLYRICVLSLLNLRIAVQYAMFRI